MAEITTNATVNGEKVSHTVNYNIGDTIQSAIDEFGEDVVHSLYVRGGTLAIQAKVGQMLRAEVAPDAIDDTMAGWRLDQRGVRTKKSKEQKATELLASMDKDALAAMLDSMGIKVK